MPKNVRHQRTTQILQLLGLTDNEAQLYVLMLRYPQSSVQEMQKWAPFPRTMLYYVLNQLQQRQLVSVQKSKGKTLYSVESPQRLYELLEEREASFSQSSQHLRNLIPSLKNRYRLAHKRPDFRLFEGLEQYQKALDAMLPLESKVIYSYGDPSHDRRPGREFRQSFEVKRVRKNILEQRLFFDTPAHRKYLKQLPYQDATQYRLIQQDLESFQVDLKLADGKLLYTTYEDREPIAILLEDPFLFGMQRSLFQAQWDQAEPASLLSLSSS